MSFDLYAFDLFAAPRDRYDFVDWISRTFRHIDGPGGDATHTTPALRAWHQEMAASFPGARDPHHHDFDSDDVTKNANYRFTQSAVQASFDWESAGPALHRAKRAAMTHGVGLFDASGREGAVWMISPRGRWEVVHRNNDQQRDFG